MRGNRLSDVLRIDGKLPLPAALALLLPVASALAYAHDRGVSHGHVRASEIFLPLDRHGDPHPKLADFGLSAACVEAGTDASPAADTLALAVTLCEAITGRPPEPGAEAAASAFEPPLPAALGEALRRALSNEADSFRDVRAFARALLPHADAPLAQAWARDFDDEHVPDVRGGGIREESPPSQETFVGGTWPGESPAKLPFPPGTSTFYIKGIVYRGVVLLVERKVPGGVLALARALEDPELASFIRQPFLTASRYDILPMLPINATIARLLQKPLATLAVEQGIGQARHDMQYVTRRLDAMTLETLHTYVPRLAESLFEVGECTAERVGAAHVVVHRRRLPEYVLPWFAPAQTAYLEEVVRWKGASTVQATLHPPLAAASRRGLAIVDLDTEIRWE